MLSNRLIVSSVRSSFPCHIALPGAYYPASEKPKLSRFNPLFEKLERGQACFIFEQDVFSDPFRLPGMGDGKDIGFIKYYGQMAGKGNKKQADDEEEETETKEATDDLKADISKMLQALKMMSEQKQATKETAPQEQALSGGLFE